MDRNRTVVMNILFIIYHPSALSNWIVKLQPYLEKYKISVIHIGKLHGVNVESISGVELYDVSHNTFYDNDQLVASINPQLVVFMSFRSLWEFIFQRICVKQNRNHIYLEHGLFSKDTLHFRTNKLKKEIWSTLKRQIVYWINEFGCIKTSQHPANEIILFIDVYLRRKFNKSPFDHYFIFSERSFDNYSKLYEMEIGVNTTLIGYPIFSDEVQKKSSEKMIKDNGGILYVHQPLISDGLASISFDQEKKWLMKIREQLIDKYNKFTILLHPRADLDAYRERFNGTGIDVIKSPNNFLVFAEHSLVIGHYSTALLYSLYFKKPTVILDYPSTVNDKIFAECFNYYVSIEDMKNAKFKVKEGHKDYMVGKNNTFEHISISLIEYLKK